MKKSQIAVVGLGVMGQSIALNIMNKGFSVVVYNRTKEKTEEFMKKGGINENLTPAYSLKEMVAHLEAPRKILLMLTAGKVVDYVIEDLLPLLDKGDIIIDGGNTYFRDTIRRECYLKEKGLYFIGAGISGGEKGALEGPSIMPSGDKKAYELVENILLDISAKTADGSPCCTYIGPNGAGHFVKMVHNGIEYADIQLICDVYQLMRNVGKFSTEKMKSIFEKWNRGRLNSYLIEITANILGMMDQDTGKPILEIIQDQAGQKGTGKWTSLEALELGVPVPSITESVSTRFLTEMKEERVKAAAVLNTHQAVPVADEEQFVYDLEQALYAAKICVYAQGYQLLQRASDQYGWNLNLGEISLIWREGCIIRAGFLNHIKKLYTENGSISNLMLTPEFSADLKEADKSIRKICISAIENGIYVPGISSTLSYYDGYRTEFSSANLLQAQRDYFGAHTYKRVDKDGDFHTIWE